jgi:hypothetical protein
MVKLPTHVLFFTDSEVDLVQENNSITTSHKSFQEIITYYGIKYSPISHISGVQMHFRVTQTEFETLKSTEQ